MRIAKEEENQIKEREESISFQKEDLKSTYRTVKKIGEFTLSSTDKARLERLRPLKRKHILKRFLKTKGSIFSGEQDKAEARNLRSVRTAATGGSIGAKGKEGSPSGEAKGKCQEILKGKTEQGLSKSKEVASSKILSRAIVKESIKKSHPVALVTGNAIERAKKSFLDVIKKERETGFLLREEKEKGLQRSMMQGLLLVLLLVLKLLVLVFGLSFVVIAALCIVFTSRMGSNTAVPEGLTEFSYFLVYESGGEGLYRAVLGDGGHAFGGYQFDNRYDLQPFLQWAYEKEPVLCSGFSPFLSLSRDSLRGNRALANTWQHIYDSNPEKFSRLQDDYVKETKLEPLIAYHKKRGLDLSNRPDVVKGLCVSIHNRKGYETSSYSYITKAGVTNETSDRDFIIKLSEAFGSRGGNIHDRWLVDYSSAACGLICEKNMALSILDNQGAVPFSGEVQNKVPYYNQGDYSYVSFNGRTVATSGCGITSFSMVASYFTGKTITPEETAPWAMANGANTVINWGAFAILAPKYGVTLERQGTGPLWGGSSREIVDALWKGKLVIGSQTGGYFNPSHGGHYIVYAGITADGKIMVNDPGNRQKVGVYDQATAFSACKQYWIFSK